MRSNRLSAARYPVNAWASSPPASAASASAIGRVQRAYATAAAPARSRTAMIADPIDLTADVIDRAELQQNDRATSTDRRLHRVGSAEACSKVRPLDRAWRFPAACHNPILRIGV